jgi:hypothetical protein
MAGAQISHNPKKEMICLQCHSQCISHLVKDGAKLLYSMLFLRSLEANPYLVDGPKYLKKVQAANSTPPIGLNFPNICEPVSKRSQEGQPVSIMARGGSPMRDGHKRALENCIKTRGV